MSTTKSPWDGILNLFVRDGVAYYRGKHAGQDVWRSLHIEADPEGKNLPIVREALRAFKAQIAQDRFAILQLTRSRNEHSTCAALFAAYVAACKGRDIGADTVTTTQSRLRNVVRTVHGEFYDVDAARCSIFTRDLAEKFAHKKIAAVKTEAEAAAAKGKPWDTEELERRVQSAKNSAKSVLQQARAIFAGDLLQSVHYSGLVLPDVSGFKEYKVGGASTVSAYVPPPAEVWKRIKADMPELRTARPDMWLAFQVAANSGLRRSSARNARWDWCVENDDGSAAMRVGRAKGNKYTVTIAPDVWAEMKAARTSVAFIIPGDYEHPKARHAARLAAQKEGKEFTSALPSRDEVVAELVAWLRARGLTEDVADKPFHLLRKIYLDAMRSEHGLDEAQKAGGHSSPQLTHAVYSNHRSTKHVRTA